MTAMPVPCSPPDPENGSGAEQAARVSVVSVARHIITHPYECLVYHWNWKAGLLGGAFRAILFAIAIFPRDSAALRGILIQLAYRVAVGGMWGAVAQAFRDAQPAWLTGVFLAAVLPAAVHLVEYAMLRAGHASHIRTGMISSVVLSIISLLLNWGLMRRGLMLTGKGTESLASDFARLPGVLAELLLAAPRRLARALRGCLA
jgi:hypothetical protein